MLNLTAGVVVCIVEYEEDEGSIGTQIALLLSMFCVFGSVVVLILYKTGAFV